jgi:cytochrome o ubiquinol oxidase operon protein cyoD
MSHDHSHEQAPQHGHEHGHEHKYEHQNEHQHEEHQGSFKSYTIGFILSIVLTIIPLYMVLNHTVTGGDLIFFILIFAVLQFIVQLFFFMHIRSGEAPRYNVMALILGLVIAFTIVASSIWIMSFNSSVQ